jgi:hypothetical protein
VRRISGDLLRSRWLWLLIGGLLIIVMVAAAIWESQPHIVDLTIEDLRRNTIFPDVKVLDILTINLRDPNTGRIFNIRRAEDGTWTAPGTERMGTLDTEAATQIAQTVVLMPFERKLPTDATTDLSQYGFTPGVLFVEFVLVDQTSHILAVGGALPERDQGLYVLVDDQPEIYVVPRGPLDFLVKKLNELPLLTPVPTITVTGAVGQTEAPPTIPPPTPIPNTCIILIGCGK